MLAMLNADELDIRHAPEFGEDNHGQRGGKTVSKRRRGLGFLGPASAALGRVLIGRDQRTFREPSHFSESNTLLPYTFKRAAQQYQHTCAVTAATRTRKITDRAKAGA